MPPSLKVWKNWHWVKQGRYKKGLTEAIRGLAMKLPRYHRATVQAIIYFPVQRIRDPADNYNQKFLMDALVRGGILEDDRERPRIEVFIWEIYNAELLK